MREFVDFITKNWILASLFLLTIIVLLQQYWSQHRFGMQWVTTEEAVALINRDQAIILDVRPAETFATGHCLGAISLEHHLLDKKIGTLEKYKTKSFIVVCQSGYQAKQSAAFLKQQGFKVYVLEGGMQQWRANVLPVVKS